jgi:putative salt-induced outer membrane protein
MTFNRSLLCATLALAASGLAQAQAQPQATVKADGTWRAVLGLGASYASGNSDSNNLSIAGDAVRATERDKWSAYGNLNYARSAGVSTSQQTRLGGRYDRNIGRHYFGFGALDLDSNRLANLQLRTLLSAGMGWHVIKSPETSLDLFGGLGYTVDQYRDPMFVAGQTRDSYHYGSLPLGEESTHKLTPSTSAKQRLLLVANLADSGAYRATWDAGLAVAMTQALSLNVGLAVQYNSDPGLARKATDTLLTTGISVKFE